MFKVLALTLALSLVVAEGAFQCYVGTAAASLWDNKTASDEMLKKAKFPCTANKCTT